MHCLMRLRRSRTSLALAQLLFSRTNDMRRHNRSVSQGWQLAYAGSDSGRFQDSMIATISAHKLRSASIIENFTDSKNWS